MRRGGERLGRWFLIGCVGLIVSRRKVDRRQFIQGLVDASFQKVTSCLLSLLTQKRERERERERRCSRTRTHTHTFLAIHVHACTRPVHLPLSCCWLAERGKGQLATVSVCCGQPGQP